MSGLLDESQSFRKIKNKLDTGSYRPVRTTERNPEAMLVVGPQHPDARDRGYG
jgi:hypothetical protein